MKKLHFYRQVCKRLLAALAALTCCQLYGTEPQAEPIKHHLTYWEHPHHIYFGPQVFSSNINYKVGNVRVDDCNTYWGFDLGYEYLKPDDLYVGIDMIVAGAGSGYAATYQNRHIPKADANAWVELGLRLGYTLGIGREMMTFFLGYGALVFGHHQYGLIETMNVFSGGLFTQYEISPYFNVGLDLRAIRTNRTNIEFRYNNWDLNYKNHHNLWGGEISVPFVWLVGGSKRWEIDLVPYFLRLGFSEAQNIYGVQLLFGYRI
jgi:hypothetical protein